MIAKLAMRVLPSDLTTAEFDRVVPGFNKAISNAYLKALGDLTPQALAVIVQANARLTETQRAQIGSILTASQRDNLSYFG